MHLLTIHYELLLDIYFYSIDFNNLITLIKSIESLILICKASYNLLLSSDSLYFWHNVWKRFGWNYNNAIYSNVIRIYIYQKIFIVSKILDAGTVILYINGNFNKITNKIPCLIINEKVNNIMKFKISPSGKFIATYENSLLTVYEGFSILYRQELKLNSWQIFESYIGNPIVVNIHNCIIKIIFKNNIIKKLKCENYLLFTGGLLIWNKNKYGRYINFRIYNPDTDNISKITCVKFSCSIPLVCPHTGIFIIFTYCTIIAFTVDNKILWEQNLESTSNINIIGYGLFTYGNYPFCSIIDMYTGKKLLQIDQTIAEQMTVFNHHIEIQDII